MFEEFKSKIVGKTIKGVTYSSRGELIVSLTVYFTDQTRLRLFAGIRLSSMDEDDKDEGGDPFVDAMVTK